MQKIMIEPDQPSEQTFQTLIEEAIVVGLSQNCKCLSSSVELKWITNLQIITFDQYQEELFELKEEKNTKYVELGNEFYLKIWFCEKNKKPITKIKTSRRLSNPLLCPLPYPYQLSDEEHLYYMVTEKPKSNILIQDVQMIEVKQDNEFDMPEQNSYQIIRLPAPCQHTMKEEYSNSEEHMITKTRYLLIKTLDLEDQEQQHLQSFQPQVIYQHSMKNKSTLIDYSSFHRFCFPEGVILHRQIIGYGYSIFNFILTQEDGTRIYVNCLKFKERLQESIIQTLPENCIDKHIHNHEVLYTEKTLCLLSKYCYTQFFHTLLEELFRKYQTEQLRRSSKYLPKNQNCQEVEFKPILLDFVEKYEMGYRESEKKYHECQFMKDDIHIDMEWDQRKISFPLPKEEFSSFYSSKAVHCLFKMLSVDKIVDVFEALLLEKTVIFVSNSQVAVGYVIESIVSFLYPLKWQQVILPILPYQLLSLLEAPMPVIAGIPYNLASDDLLHQLKQDSIIVFLDCNDILNKERQSYPLNHLKQARKKLRVYDIYNKHHVEKMLAFKDQFYLFKIHEKEEENQFSAELIKHIFFETVLKLLQNYQHFYRKDKEAVESSSPLKNGRKKPFNLKKDYQLMQFLKSHPKANVKFMKKFIDASHFITFLYNYHDGQKNPNKEFIDNAMKRQSNSKSEKYIFEQNRLSEQHYSQLEVNNLKKKASWPDNLHNITWSPQPKKMEEGTTNFSKTLDRNSVKLEEIELEREKSHSEEKKKVTPGSNICDAITRAMHHVSTTKKNLFMWTAARVTRLKKQYLGQKEKETGQEEEPKQQNEEREREQPVSIKMVKQICEEEAAEQPQKKDH